MSKRKQENDNVSDWQTGVPPCEGVWEIWVDEHDRSYFARYAAGTWGAGYQRVTSVPKHHSPYPDNNDRRRPRKWRGLLA